MTRCKHCGARKQALRSVCDYCGTPYQSGRDSAWSKDTPGAPSSVGGVHPPGEMPVSDPWQRLATHPQLEAALREGPTRPVPSTRREAVPASSLALLAMVGAAMGLMATGGIGGPSRPMLLFVALPAVLSLLRRRRRRDAFPGAPLEALPARLLEVTEPWGRTQDPRPKAVLEVAPDRRRHLRLRRDLIGSLRPGDAGVAFVKADVLVDFRRLDASTSTGPGPRRESGTRG